MYKDKVNSGEKLKENDFKKVDNLVFESKKKGFVTYNQINKSLSLWIDRHSYYQHCFEFYAD